MRRTVSRNRHEWSWSEDRQWARSRLDKRFLPDGSLRWGLEVRTEDYGAGNMRMGEVVVRGTQAGELLIQILED